MMTVHINMDAIRYGMMHPEYQRHTNFMVSRAINMTLYNAREKQVSKRPFGEMRTVLRTIKDDGGKIIDQFEQRRRVQNYKPGSGEIDDYIKGSATSWTKRGFMVAGSNKSNLTGSLFFQEDRYYMKWMIYGGTALPKRRKTKVPIVDKGRSRVTLNAFGGIKGRDPIKRLKAAQKRWVGHPRNWPQTPANYGLWERYGRGKKPKIRKLIALDSQRIQRPQYPAHQLTSDYFNLHFPRILRKAFLEATKLKDFRSPAGRQFGGGF